MKYSQQFTKDGQTVIGSWFLLGTAVLGPIWLLVQKMWMPALIYFLICVASVVSGAFLWPFLAIPFFMPFLTSSLVRAWYRSQGWDEIGGVARTAAAIPKPVAQETDRIAKLESELAAMKQTAPVPKAKPVDTDERGIPTYSLD